MLTLVGVNDRRAAPVAPTNLVERKVQEGEKGRVVLKRCVQLDLRASAPTHRTTGDLNSNKSARCETRGPTTFAGDAVGEQVLELRAAHDDARAVRQLDVPILLAVDD